MLRILLAIMMLPALLMPPGVCMCRGISICQDTEHADESCSPKTSCCHHHTDLCDREKKQASLAYCDHEEDANPFPHGPHAPQKKHTPDCPAIVKGAEGRLIDPNPVVPSSPTGNFAVLLSPHALTPLLRSVADFPDHHISSEHPLYLSLRTLLI